MFLAVVGTGSVGLFTTLKEGDCGEIFGGCIKNHPQLRLKLLFNESNSNPVYKYINRIQSQPK